MDLVAMTDAIRAVCPIDGIDYGHTSTTDADGNIVRSAEPVARIQFRPQATAEQRAAAEVVLASYDPAVEAQIRNIAAARDHVVRYLPPNVRASMHSYWLAHLTSTDPVAVADRAKFAEIEAWETTVLSQAGQATLPAPPAWLADFAKDF